MSRFVVAIRSSMGGAQRSECPSENLRRDNISTLSVCDLVSSEDSARLMVFRREL